MHLNGDCALRLAKAGVPLFPAGPDKRPLVRWRERSSADPRTVAGMWQSSPQALPAIDCGKADLVVIDGDRHSDGPDGVVALRELFKAHGFPARAVPVVETPGNGVHLYFRQGKERLTNWRGGLPDGCDVRADGGFVIAPGAILPDGRTYAPKPGAPTLLESLSSLPEVPGWLVRILGAPKPSPHPTHHEPIRIHSGERERSYSVELLDRIVSDIGGAAKGQRNALLNRGAFRLGTMVAWGWLSWGEAEARLLSAAHACGLAGDDGERSARATIKSGLEAGRLKEPRR